MAQVAKTKRIFDNRYEILSIVGRGHVSVVYHAVHLKSPSTEVALKVLVNRKDQKSSAERLRKEALAMVSSRHRYVVRLDDFHSMGDLCYLSMEFAPESDLRRYIHKLGTALPMSQAQIYLSQMAQALSFVHKVGIIHRDIKADNILVVNERESRLADFSVAVLPGEESSLEELQTGVGTMAYMAPEVLEGRSYEPSSDLYALGVTFYELLTGKHPFEQAPLSQQLDIRRDGGFPHVLDLAPAVPRYLADIIMRAMRYDRALRFSSAEEMVALLSAGASAEPQSTPVTSGPAKTIVVEPAPKKESIAPKTAQTSPVEPLPAPEKGPSPSGIRKTRYAQKIEQMRKDRQESKADTEPAAPKSEVTQRIEPVATGAAVDSDVTQRIEHPVKPQEMRQSPEEPAEPSGRVHRRQRGRTPTEKIDQSIVDQIRAARAQEPEKPVEPPPAAAASRTESAVSEQSAPGQVTPLPKGQLPWKPLVAALLFLTLIYYWRFSGSSEPSPSAATTAEQPAASSAPSKDSLIPPVVDTTLSFPALPAGVYHGVLQGFIPNREAPLTMLSIPGKRLLVVLIGIPGMVPASIDLAAWQKRAEESGEAPALRVAANGQVLEFTGKQIDDSLQGSFVNLVTGDEGTWFVRPMRGGDSQ